VQENHGKKSSSISTTDGIKSLDTSYWSACTNPGKWLIFEMLVGEVST
jgi:hypothetical protein